MDIPKSFMDIHNSYALPKSETCLKALLVLHAQNISFMGIHNSFMDIPKSFMGVHNSFMDIPKSFMDIHNSYALPKSDTCLKALLVLHAQNENIC